MGPFLHPFFLRDLLVPPISYSVEEKWKGKGFGWKFSYRALVSHAFKPILVRLAT